MAHCPECDANINISNNTKVGEVITCPDCAAQLEVLTVTPAVKLILAPEIEEDWGE